jgi:8-oxo-dGTP pyrophosphatase MutT (NUDIX family)
MPSKHDDLLDIFQPGLTYGAARLKYAPHKRYFYVEHPTEGWRVYIRNVAMLHEQGVPFEPERFIVVKDTDSIPSSYAWEPPKGQMEAKDGLEKSKKPLLDRMAVALLREIEEEAKISKVNHLQYTGLVLQSRENDYPPNTFFQYHIFKGEVPLPVLSAAREKFDWFKEHPAAFKQQRADKREKDAISWFIPKKTRLFGRWSPSIVALYLQHAKHL